MFHLFSKTLPAFGLDVSEGAIKILQFVPHGGGVQVKGFSDLALTKGLVINDTISDPSTFAYLLKGALQKMQYGSVTTNNVILSVPESKAFVRVIQIPRMSDEEAGRAIPFEAENFIPLPIDQVYLDWQKIGDTDDKMNVLMIASPRDFIDKYISVVEKAGVKPIAMEVESQSCHRALIAPGSTETLLIVDLDAVRSNLIMVEEGNIQFTSSIPIAGNSFTESIARTLGVSAVKAEAIKRKVGIANTPEYPNVKTALLPVLQNLSAEVKNILKFHNDHSSKQVSRMLLAGGGARIQNLVDYLTPEFAEFPGMKIELANPWQNVHLVGQQLLGTNDSLDFTTVIGLASRGVNFEIQ